ncbi:MAG: VOC family protein [Polyangiaceae bacterium]|jgi:PhnB protein|nr:VOC family protein [Polyangiaceae bacterium]
MTSEEEVTSPNSSTSGQPGVTPYLCCRSALRALEYYRVVFGAIERSRVMQPDGRLGHAEIMVGSALIMLADEFPEIGFRSPRSLGGSPVYLHLRVERVDEVFERAIAGGARSLRPVADQAYGERSGQIEDPFGHVWILATPKR